MFRQRRKNMKISYRYDNSKILFSALQNILVRFTDEKNDKFCRKVARLMYTEMVNFFSFFFLLFG